MFLSCGCAVQPRPAGGAIAGSRRCRQFCGLLLIEISNLNLNWDTESQSQSQEAMMAAKRRASGGAQPSGDAQMVVRLFRTVTEEQFDVWLACLNRAANAMGSDAPAFTRDDRQKTISYWYLL